MLDAALADRIAIARDRIRPQGNVRAFLDSTTDQTEGIEDAAASPHAS
ncbi:MAG TPA: hypothetical protein VJ276_23665 [Thermoanaerobaculia bacterium]|nr:hypothetical protein [Thermoanaerobaculia bacterium]